jgi:dipeptidyl aminopeptidase/acylaminoacyl peptidase
MAKTVAPYGTWRSPFTAERIAQGAITLAQPAIAGDDLYWLELRPSEKGRNVLVRRGAGDVTPAGFNVRTRVHEYGGGDFLIAGETVYFSNFADQRVHRQDGGGAPRPITPAAELRYADYQLDARRGRLICVREDKRLLESREDVNTLVAIDLDGDEAGGRVLVAGNEFYHSPRLSPDGSQLAWLTWNFPAMPWDAAELWLGEIADDGSVANGRHIAGGPGEAIVQPEWSPDGTLYFVSDREDWWNLHRLRDGRVEAVCREPADFAGPQWIFGASTYAFVGPQTILATWSERGIWRLGTIDTTSGALSRIDSPYGWIATLRGAPGRAVFVAGSPAAPTAVVRFDLATGVFETVRRSTDLTLDPADASVPEPIEFPTENGLTAHGFFYRPANRDFTAPAGERPPLVVRAHGGPTSATNTSLSLPIQYLTSRGIAVLDVNYGGSTGFGRAYRQPAVRHLGHRRRRRLRQRRPPPGGGRRGRRRAARHRRRQRRRFTPSCAP